MYCEGLQGDYSKVNFPYNGNSGDILKGEVKFELKRASPVAFVLCIPLFGIHRDWTKDIHLASPWRTPM